jgi:hypothetical protein
MMIDKSNIKTSDWLIKGISPKKLEKEKSKAIKSAEKEIARKKKKERNKEMRAYRKMHRRHRKELVKLAKKVRVFDYGWIDELVLTQITHMHEYFSAGNNIWQTDETRLPIVKQLKYVIDLYEELDDLWTTCYDSVDNVDKTPQKYQREEELYQEIYSYIGSNLRNWWD